MSFEGKVIGKLIARTFLGGIIQDCLLVVKDNIAKIRAIDPNTQGLFLEVSSKVEGINDITLGLNNLKMITTFLEKAKKPVKYLIRDNMLRLIKSNKETISILLLEKDAIASLPKTDKTKDYYIGKTKTSFACNRKLADKIFDYCKMMEIKTIKLIADGEQISINSGEIKERGFAIPKAGKCAKVDETISSEIYADNFLAVLKTILVDKDIEATIHIGLNMPVVIEQGDDHWILIPITNE